MPFYWLVFFWIFGLLQVLEKIKTKLTDIGFFVGFLIGFGYGVFQWILDISINAF